LNKALNVRRQRLFSAENLNSVSWSFLAHVNAVVSHSQSQPANSEAPDSFEPHSRV
jgi:hypothetical protein